MSQIVKIGEPYLTRYERARIVGARALQISHGAPLLIDTEENDFRPHDVAHKELRARVLPIGLARRLPNGDHQIIPLVLLKDRESISQIDEDMDISRDNGQDKEMGKTSQDQITKASEPEEVSEEADEDLTQIAGVGESTADMLKDAGFRTVSSIANASVKDLTGVKGVGKSTAEKFIEAAKELV